ncbi:MAG: STAS domain-containing protein [Brevinematales bacterium]|nr:STAS domain-containing protein [Brevinematales bacterium]
MVSLEFRETIAIFQVIGNLDVSDAQSLEEMGRNLIHQGKCRFLVDLRGVPYLHSSGARALLVLLRETKAHQGRMVLVGLQPKVKKTLEIIGLGEIFEVVDSVDDAMAILE